MLGLDSESVKTI